MDLPAHLHGLLKTSPIENCILASQQQQKQNHHEPSQQQTQCCLTSSTPIKTSTSSVVVAASDQLTETLPPPSPSQQPPFRFVLHANNALIRPSTSTLPINQSFECKPSTSSAPPQSPPSPPPPGRQPSPSAYKPVIYFEHGEWYRVKIYRNQLINRNNNNNNGDNNQQHSTTTTATSTSAANNLSIGGEFMWNERFARIVPGMPPSLQQLLLPEYRFFIGIYFTNPLLSDNMRTALTLYFHHHSETPLMEIKLYRPTMSSNTSGGSNGSSSSTLSSSSNNHYHRNRRYDHRNNNRRGRRRYQSPPPNRYNNSQFEQHQQPQQHEKDEERIETVLFQTNQWMPTMIGFPYRPSLSRLQKMAAIANKQPQHHSENEEDDEEEEEEEPFLEFDIRLNFMVTQFMYDYYHNHPMAFTSDCALFMFSRLNTDHMVYNNSDPGSFTQDLMDYFPIKIFWPGRAEILSQSITRRFANYGSFCRPKSSLLSLKFSTDSDSYHHHRRHHLGRHHHPRRPPLEPIYTDRPKKFTYNVKTVTGDGEHREREITTSNVDDDIIPIIIMDTANDKIASPHPLLISRNILQWYNEMAIYIELIPNFRFVDAYKPQLYRTTIRFATQMPSDHRTLVPSSSSNQSATTTTISTSSPSITCIGPNAERVRYCCTLKPEYSRCTFAENVFDLYRDEFDNSLELVWYPIRPATICFTCHWWQGPNCMVGSVEQLLRHRQLGPVPLVVNTFPDLTAAHPTITTTSTVSATAAIVAIDQQPDDFPLEERFIWIQLRTIHPLTTTTTTASITNNSSTITTTAAVTATTSPTTTISSHIVESNINICNTNDDDEDDVVDISTSLSSISSSSSSSLSMPNPTSSSSLTSTMDDHHNNHNNITDIFRLCI